MVVARRMTKATSRMRGPGWAYAAGEARNTKHAIRPVEGQETSMHMEELQQATDDDGRMAPLRGEYEEEDNDESWHDAREDWWEMTAYGKAMNGDEAVPRPYTHRS